MRSLRCTLGVNLAQLQSTQTLPADYLANTLINELIVLPGKLVLALDDFHRIEGNAVPEFVSRLLDHLPPQVCLVLATRQDPILPLIRLRAGGEMLELRMADLCFSHPEVQAFLEASIGLGLSPQAVRTLEVRTEGWIVGLRLAALSLQGAAAPEAFVEAFEASGHRYVMEYLVDQVLSLQPPEIRDFLLQTAILDRFCVPLCDAVLARKDNHAHTFCGMCTRLYTKLTAHTLCIYINRLLGKPDFLQIKALAFPIWHKALLR